MRGASSAAALLAVFLVSAGCQKHDPYAACRDVDCGAGTCVLIGGSIACACPDGWLAHGLSCEAADAGVDPCGGACTAPHKSVCVTSEGIPACACDPDAWDDHGVCRPIEACSPNPCTAPHQTFCTPLGDSHRCDCDPGYELTNGCTPVPAPDCSASHVGNGSDRFEPNECPSIALPISLDAGYPATISPVGDVDWYRFSAEANHIYEIKAFPHDFCANLNVYVDGGTASVAAPYNSYIDASRYWSPVATDVYSRVSAGSLKTCAYELAVTDVGTDDFGNSISTASLFTPGHVNGALQYANDVDVFELPLTGGRAYRLRGLSSWSDFVAEFFDASGNALTAPGYTIDSNLGPASSGSIYLKLSSSQGMLQTYWIDFTDLGPDDAPNTLPSSVPLADGGTFEYRNDVDVWTIPVIAGHSYGAHLVGGNEDVSFYSQVIRFIDSSGTTIGSRNADWAAMTASSSGTAYVEVAGTGGPYQVELAEFTGDDYGNTLQTAATRTADGIAFTAAFETPGDEDVFVVHGPPGELYAFQCTPPAGAAIGVYGAAGMVSSLQSPWLVHAKASANGDIWFKAQDLQNAGAFSYSCKITDEGTDDVPDTIAATTVSLTPGTSASYLLEVASDQDVFSVAGAARHEYQASCSVVSPPPGFQSDCRIEILNSSGAVLATGGGGYQAVTVVNGAFYVRVSGYGLAAETRYAVLVQDVAVDEDSDTPATAVTLQAQTATTSARLNSTSDADYFRFNAVAGHWYTFTASLGNPFYVPLAVQVLDANGQPVTAHVNDGVAVLKASVGGDLFFKVSWGSGAVGYTYAFEDDGLDDYGDTQQAATTISVPGSGSAVSEVGYDVDAFQLTTTAAHAYAFQASGVAMSVYDSAGNEVYRASNQLTWLSSTGGTFYVLAQKFQKGTWTWTLSDLGTDDIGNTPSSGLATTPSSSTLTGHIEYAQDHDCFTFQAIGGHNYRAVPNGTSTDPVHFRMLSSTGTNLLDAPSGYGSSSTVPFGWRAQSSGTYCLEVTPTSGFSTFPITYTFTLQDLGVDDCGDTFTSACGPASFGIPFALRIEAQGDHDVLSIQATAQHILRATCTPVSGAPCWVRFQNATGDYGYTTTGPGAVFTDQKVPSTGTYFVSVSSANLVVGDYQLTFEDRGLDDYGDTTQTASPLQLNTPINGGFDFLQDVDAFAISSPVGVARTVTFSGASGAYFDLVTPNGPLSSGVLSSGQPVTFTPTTGTTWLLIRSANLLGSYSLEVQ